MKEIYDGPIKKVRAICKKVKKSPTVNDCLQAEIRKQRDSEKALKLDCQTRWNSLLRMLDDYIDLHEIIVKVFNGLGEWILIDISHIGFKCLCGGDSEGQWGQIWVLKNAPAIGDRNSMPSSFVFPPSSPPYITGWLWSMNLWNQVFYVLNFHMVGEGKGLE